MTTWIPCKLLCDQKTRHSIKSAKCLWAVPPPILLVWLISELFPLSSETTTSYFLPMRFSLGDAGTRRPWPRVTSAERVQPEPSPVHKGLSVATATSSQCSETTMAVTLLSSLDHLLRKFKLRFTLCMSPESLGNQGRGDTLLLGNFYRNEYICSFWFYRREMFFCPDIALFFPLL